MKYTVVSTWMDIFNIGFKTKVRKWIILITRKDNCSLKMFR
jgi:hypothetical protein